VFNDPDTNKKIGKIKFGKKQQNWEIVFAKTTFGKSLFVKKLYRYFISLAIDCIFCHWQKT